MRRIHVDKVNDGMILARTIFSYDGNILLNSGIRLRETYVKKLKELGYGEIYINDEISADIEIQDVISDETRFEARMAIKNAMDGIRYGCGLDTKPVRNIVGKIVEELMTSRDTMINLYELRSSDQYTFSHCVNVAVLSIITGISLKYDKDKLKDLGIGAMLHDVGKIKVPNEILNKPGKLTDEEFKIMKKHTNYGYEILKKSLDLNTYAAYIALTHHEKFNGEGYPLGIKGPEIHEYSRIVSIADVYDAITSDRVYRKRININEAVEYLIGMGNHSFDYDIVRNFIEHITIYPLGTIIQLNTGQVAIVVDVNKKYPNRPVIRIIKDEEGNKLSHVEELDLTKHNTIIITGILDDI